MPTSRIRTTIDMQNLPAVREALVRADERIAALESDNRDLQERLATAQQQLAAVRSWIAQWSHDSGPLAVAARELSDRMLWADADPGGALTSDQLGSYLEQLVQKTQQPPIMQRLDALEALCERLRKSVHQVMQDGKHNAKIRRLQNRVQHLEESRSEIKGQALKEIRALQDNESGLRGRIDALAADIDSIRAGEG